MTIHSHVPKEKQFIALNEEAKQLHLQTII
jgi:hypothetical protein